MRKKKMMFGWRENRENIEEMGKNGVTGWVWKKKENVVVFGDGNNDGTIGWRGVSEVIVDQNGRERNIYIYIYLIKSYEKKKRMFGLRKNGENVEEREEGKWCGGLQVWKMKENIVVS